MEPNYAKPGFDAATELLSIVKVRTAAYGGFRADAETTVALVERVFGIRTTPHDLCKVLLSMKFGRLANGDITRDSLLDIAGYACILADMLRPNKECVANGT